MAITNPTANATTPVTILMAVIVVKDPIARIAKGDATIKPIIPQYAYSGNFAKIISINLAMAKTPTTTPIPKGAKSPTPVIMAGISRDNAERIKSLIAERIGL